MRDIYLISPNYIREASEMGDDVEDKYIKRSMLSSQDIDIQGILGTELYELILDGAYAYAVSGTSMETRIEELLDDYVIPTLLYSVLKDVLPYVYFKITPKTVGTQDGQYMKPTDYDLLTLLKKDYDEKYQHYMLRLTNFLFDNSSTYPEYGMTRTDGGSQNMKPVNATPFSGLQL